MPIPDAIWQALLANTQAAGQSFNPWSLGAAAQPAAGGSLDDVIAEARARLSGGAIPAAPAAGAGTAEASAPMTELGGGPTALPGQGPLGAGQAFGYNPAAVQTGLNFVGLPGGLFGGLPAQAAISAAKALNSIPAVQGFLQDAAPFGMITDQGPSSAVISSVARDDPGFFGFASSLLGAGNVPTAGVPTSQFGPESTLGLPGGGERFGADRSAETGIAPGFGGTLSGGKGTEDIGAPGQEGGVAPGGGGPGGGPGTGTEGSGGTGGAGGESTQSAHAGGRIKGKRGTEKKVKVKPGEFVLNENAADAYGSLLDEMNASAPADLDSLMSKARAFWDV